MVLAYAQSGAAAHIAGLIAKTIDVGYRLVIVVSGATNLVRQQLQRRLDEELPSLPDTAGIIRLTSPEMDYQRLASHLGALRFEKRVESRPLFGQENIDSASVRLMVVKKNKAVLRKLARDLAGIGTPLDEVPALIVDAEASRGPSSAIDKAVAELLAMLPRAQYISFSSTPLTAALLNASMPEHTFPRDFVTSLPRPAGYVGARELFSIGDEATSTGVDWPAFSVHSSIRHVDAGPEGLREALDMFVLTGALKAYRESLNAAAFPNHLMFVRGSVRRAARELLRARISQLWQSNDYDVTSGQERLIHLFETEFLRSSEVHKNNQALPQSVAELRIGLQTSLGRLSSGVLASSDPEAGWKIVLASRATDNLMFGEAPTITCIRQ
ncbi:hypothetical protein [Kribbella sp. NPDC051137]|uniref:hypothetical protein n=1 Tax=Kribbella sp. NPDC051137 TaxID=3155045 RepID=UPI003435AB35